MSSELQNVTIQATIDTPYGRITFQAPYPLKYKRNIEVTLLDGEVIDWDESWMSLEYVQCDCAKALASESYDMFNQLRDFIDGKDCPMDGLQEEDQ